MKFTFLGGVDEVGASSILLEISGRRLLVDCGIRPSPKSRFGLAGDQLPDLSLLDQAGEIDAILVTHAHTDHTGALELVTGRYPGVPVYATPPTIALTRVLHQDSRRIMKTRLEEEGELPIFDDVAVGRLMSAFEPVPFNARLPLGEGLAVTFFPAGHIAGAAMLGLESDEGRVLISGDVSFTPQRTVGGAKLPSFEPDVLLVESTYGGRLHANRAVQERRMVEVVREVTTNGGKVLIPAFALGRAQELLVIMNEFQRRGELPPVPVWADGMVRSICQVYSSFKETLPLALQEQGASFFRDSIHPVRSAEERNSILWDTSPAVIISSSGMLAGGPSQAYARALAGQAQHAILLTGYQDEEAPGRRLQEMAVRGRGTLWLGKNKVDVQCRLGTYSLSAHADEGQLISMVETLNPAHVILVHGDEEARLSLLGALKERKRNVHTPRAGQSLVFRFETARSLPQRGIGRQQPVDLHVLWQEVAGEAGGYFRLEELCQVWWGETSDQAQCDRLADALAEDNLYFSADPHRPDVYRARPAAQVALAMQRREKMAGLGDLAGQWLTLRAGGNSVRVVRCAAIARDSFWIETEEGEAERAWPEDVLAAHGSNPPDTAAVQPSMAGMVSRVMEPNQALVYAGQQFPREARLRKTGYHLDRHVLLLTFDFPDMARERYAEIVTGLETATGWAVEISPEANQNALFALVKEVLPDDWRVIKGPALYRQTQQVAVTAANPDDARVKDLAAVIEEVCRRYQAESGFELKVSLASGPSQPGIGKAQPAVPSSPAAISLVDVEPAARPWEINAAYGAIKTALEGSTLYRTSLKGGEIMLSFISPQVGERYREQIQAISRQIGWPLRINPQTNQGAITEAVTTILARAEALVTKGPSLYPEKGCVEVKLSEGLEEDRLAEISEEVEEQTGFRLLIIAPSADSDGTTAPAHGQGRAAENVVMIPLARVRLRRFHQELSLDPLKVDKAVERTRRLGQISPPIQVRRLEDGYLLLDGLYRLRAAEALGLPEIPAIIE